MDITVIPACQFWMVGLFDTLKASLMHASTAMEQACLMFTIDIVIFAMHERPVDDGLLSP